jgi:hypothetical protein
MVTDDKIGSVTNIVDKGNGDNFLDPFEMWTFKANGTAIAGQYNNLGTVTANSVNPLDPSPTATDPSSYFGEPAITPPGVRTPGFWQNTQWQKFWDGIQGNEPPQAGTPNFPTGDLFYPPYTNSAVPGKVQDPLTGQYQTGVLIGDYNRNGTTDAGEDTLFYTREQALQIVDSSQHPKGQQQDQRYTLGRSLVAAWLNYLAGNPIDTANPNDKDARYYINEGIDWLQALTPDENTPKDGKGDGALHQLVVCQGKNDE